MVKSKNNRYVKNWKVDKTSSQWFKKLYMNLPAMKNQMKKIVLNILKTTHIINILFNKKVLKEIFFFSKRCWVAALTMCLIDKNKFSCKDFKSVKVIKN